MQSAGMLSTKVFEDGELPVLDSLPTMRDIVNKIANSTEFSTLSKQFARLDSEKNRALEEAFYTVGSTSSFY